jgi:alpha-L-rhamnosidase
MRLFLIAVTAAVLVCAEPLAPTRLKCEYLVNPMGIDVAQPRLSWVLNHTDRNQKQSAYQVVVSTWPELEG